MKERLIEFMRVENLSAVRLAEIAGVQPSTISHILSGRNKPGFDFLSNIMTHYPNLNARWFVLGEGEMYGSDNNTKAPGAPAIDTPVDRVDAPHDDLTEVSTPDKRVEKIGFFYDNGTFSIYKEA